MGIRENLLRVSFDADLKNLFKYSIYSTQFHVCYASYCINPEYLNYFKQEAKKQGTYVLLAQLPESFIPDSDYIALGHDIGARYIVATDNITDNLTHFQKFMQQWHQERSRNRQLKVLCCPHDHTVGLWRKQCAEMLSDEYVSGICISTKGISGGDTDEVVRNILYSLSRPEHLTKKYYIHIFGIKQSLLEYLRGEYRDVNSLNTGMHITRQAFLLEENRFLTLDLKLNPKLKSLKVSEDFVDDFLLKNPFLIKQPQLNDVVVLHNIACLLKGVHTMDTATN